MLLNKYYNYIFRSTIALISPSNVQPNRAISTTSMLLADYYATLGVTPNSTQADIKAAYYKLSMIYHPDKNVDNDDAVKKFRAITEAYEVLGNFRLRKLYDKGVVHTAGHQFAHVRNPNVEDIAEEPEDDAQTKFYKAHMKKAHIPTPSGRTPIYDFDEWSRQHYGKTFERRQRAKAKHNYSTEREQMEKHSTQKEYLLFGMVFAIVCMWALVKIDSERDIDSLPPKNVNAKDKE